MARRMRNAGMALAAVAALAATAAGGATDEAERFLPATTFMYGGVAKLGPGFGRITKLLQGHIPLFGVQPLDRFVLSMLARELELEGADDPDGFAAQTGLDPDGSAGIAWVLTDPSSDPGRSLNENALLILPIRDAARAEALLARKVLAETFRESRRQSRRVLSRIRDAKRKLAQTLKDKPEGPITWEMLAQATPGLKELRCPLGGEIAIGGWDQEPTSSALANGEPEGPQAYTRDALGVRQVGDVALVGGRAKGTGYALTRSHIVFSNNVLVLEDAVAAAAADRARLAPPSTPPPAWEGRGYIDTAYLFQMLKQEFRLAPGGRGFRRSPPAAKRLAALFDAPRGLTLDVALATEGGRTTIPVAVTWAIADGDVTRPWLAQPPAPLAVLKLLPARTVLAFATNLGRPLLALLADLAATEEPALAGAIRLAAAGSTGDGAFAFTRGVFADEMPNMIFALHVGDRAMMDGALETWLAMMAKETRAERGVEQSEVDGVTVRSVRGKRGMAFHFATIGPFVVACSDLADIKAMVAADKGGPSLATSPRYRALALPDGPANAAFFLDMPALMADMGQAQHQRQVRYFNEGVPRELKQLEDAIAKFKQQKDRIPQDLDELRRETKGWVPRGRYFRGKYIQYQLDPNTGHVSLPGYGTRQDFRPADPAVPRHKDEEELVFSAFGVSGLTLRVEGGAFKARGVLCPAPQRRAERGGF